MSNLPSPIAGFEKLNKRKVNFDMSIPIRDERYELRSVVYSDVNIKEGRETDLVIGSSALVRIPVSLKAGRAVENFVCYDPYGPVTSRSFNDGARADAPVTAINEVDANSLELSFRGLAESRGTVFIYATDGNIDEKKEIGL
jgi:hypothetical protein